VSVKEGLTIFRVKNGIPELLVVMTGAVEKKYSQPSACRIPATSQLKEELSIEKAGFGFGMYKKTTTGMFSYQEVSIKMCHLTEAC
jgi:hypothetical protein